MQNATVSRYDGSGAENRHVGAVQRGDRARHALRPRVRVEDLPREIRRGRVRNGVMRVDDVEPMRA